MNTIFKITFAGLFFIFFGINGTAQVKQQKIARVDQMPNLPKPFQIIDYKKMAVSFDSTVYDFNAKGRVLTRLSAYSHLNHFKILLACTALWTSPVHGHFSPWRPRSNAMIGRTQRLVIDPSTN